MSESTAARLWVHPLPDRLVRLEDGRRLTIDGANGTFKCPAEGVPVRWSLYIARRIEAGDLEQLDAPAEAPVEAPAAAPADAAPKTGRAPAPIAAPAAESK